MSTNTGRSRQRRVRATAAAVLIGAVAVVAACTPSPRAGDPPEDPPEWFAGGTFPIEVSVPSRTTTATFPLLWGLGSCTTTVTTPSVEIPDGTLTLAAVEVDPGAATVTIPRAALELPGSVVSAGSVALHCNDTLVGGVGLSISFDGAASVGSAVLDTTTETVTLSDASVSITNAALRIGGAASGWHEVPLDPFDAAVPTISVPLGGGGRVR